jgi:hypothetical protein
MTDSSIVTQLPLWPFVPETLRTSEKPPDLHIAWQLPQYLPQCVTDSPTVMRCLNLLGPLDWVHFPERNLQRNWGQVSIPYATLAAAELIRLEESLPSAKRLRRHLLEHPGFIWLLGFPLTLAPETPLGFSTRASLPTHRHFTRLLRNVPNAALQFLLADSVRAIRAELATRQVPAVDCVSLDTKHIIAWVKENNPKAYVKKRYDKTQQPVGDPDCRLGCKRKHNRTTPTQNGLAGSCVPVGEYYWGYGSGVVVAKVPGWGEFVIVELTQPFDQGDTTYFRLYRK